MEIIIFGFIIGILTGCIMQINKKIKKLDDIIEMILNNSKETLGRIKSFYLDIDDFSHQIDNLESNPPFNNLQQAMPTNSILSMVKAQLDGIEEYLSIKKEFYNEIDPSSAPKIQRLRYVKADKVKQNTKK